MSESRCTRCKRPSTRMATLDVAVGPQPFCCVLCEVLWAQAAAEREGCRP